MDMNLSKQDYSEFAKAAVADLIDREIPLEDSVVKIAQEHGLNQDQVHRLIEQTNTLAHLNLFEKMSGEDGKYVQFKTADPDNVIPSTQKTAAFAPRAASTDPEDGDFLLPLPNEHYAEKCAELEKTASDDSEIQEILRATSPNTNPYDGARGFDKVARVRGVARELELHTLEEYERYKLACESLLQDLRRKSPEELLEFEKDAYALHPDDAEIVLSHLHVISEKRFTPGLEKTARTRKLVLCGPVHEKLAECVSARQKALEYGQAYEALCVEAKPLL